MTHKIGTKGQMVIEKSIREALGIEPGMVAAQEIVGDHLQVRFFPAEHDRSLRGALAQARQRSVPEDATSPLDDAWPKAARQEWLEHDQNG